MKRNLIILFATALLLSCAAPPKNFSYFYRNENTKPDKLINIEGYYVSQHGCDSSFFSVYMFYPTGLFTIATTSKLLPELTDCFEKGGKSAICKYPLWGTYRIEGDLIRTQVIRPEGNGCTIFRDYKILPDGNIVNVSDYVEPRYTNLKYMENYPSFKDNPCETEAVFYPLQSKRDSTDCPWLRKKWFWDKE